MYKIVKELPFLLFLMFAISQSTESAYSTGLPQLAKDFSISNAIAQSTSSIYFLGFALGILFLGRLSDYIGRKPVIIAGYILFLITCVMSFFVSSVNELIIIRFFQAFGASVGSVVAQAVARDSYKGDELSRLFASLGAALAVMPSISSLIGSNITEFFGWRYIFIYLAILVLFTLLMAIFNLKETNNFKGINQQFSFFYVLKVIVLDTKVVCFAIIIGCYNGVLYSMFIESPFVFINKLGFNNTQYGYVSAALGLSAALGGLYSRVQQKNIDGKRIIFIGMIISIITLSSFFMTAVFWYNNILYESIITPLLVISLSFQCFSFGMIMPLILRYSLEDYTKINGTAGAIFGTSYYIIIALCNFLTTILHNDFHILYVASFFLILSFLSYILYMYSYSYNNKYKIFSL